MTIWEPWLDNRSLRKLERHPLLTELSEGRIGLNGVRTLLIQHRHYSRHFTRYLCALMSNISNVDDLHAIMENLLEEMGIDGGENVTHAELFQRTLDTLNADPCDEGPLPATRALTQSVMEYCRKKDPLEGLAALCLGAEAIVPLVYRPILDALVGHGVGDRATEFFRIHIEEDEGHALTMLNILQRLTARDASARERARSIGADVIAKRCDMFDAVLQEIRGRGGDDVLAHRRITEPPPHFSSIDFGRVSSKLSVFVPDRLHHPRVTSSHDTESKKFTEERNHAVHIVDLPTNTLSVTIGGLQPGQSTRLHRHNYETVIYVISGSGHSRIEDRVVHWTAGDAFYVPVWAAHQHANDGTGPCTYVACENAPLLQNIGNIALREELG
ncbi:iron-containing redox enzyme family protein [Pendulispora brunnea]|uniref:Iron-containing redox enzyme family protein n=1 Tax=Pendulispora brunnea TaxID=2905690 RepID=A0ABZ2K7Q6_9BACT